MSPKQVAGYLRLLQRAIVLARFGSEAGETQRVWDILNAVHNFPGIIAGTEHYSEEYIHSAITRLVAKHPGLAELAELCESAREL